MRQQENEGGRGHPEHETAGAGLAKRIFSNIFNGRNGGDKWSRKSIS